MSEAVEVIISADDQASKKMAEISANAEREFQKVEAERQKAEAKRAADQRRIESLREREINQLKLLRVELMDGAEAAEALSLQMQGLSEKEAKSIARQRAELSALRAEMNKPPPKMPIATNPAMDFRGAAGKFKAAAEFSGSIAMLAGGSELQMAAMTVGQLTEKVSQFSEVSKLGGAGALAFKAGLAGVVGVLSYQVGSYIGNWIFQQEDLNEELAKTAELLRESGNEVNRLASREFANKKELIQLLPNKEQQQRDLRDLLESTKQEIAKQEALIASKGTPADEADKAEIEVLKSRRSMLKQQAEDLQVELSGHKEMVAQLREQNAEREKSAQYLKQLEEEVAMMKLRGDELLRAQSYQKAYGEDARKAFALLKEKAALEQKAKDDEMARVAAQQQAERDRQKAEQQARENERIAQQKAKEEAERQKRLNDPTLLSATESRLLSRGTGNTTQKILNDQLAKLDEIARGITEGNRGGIRGVKVA